MEIREDINNFISAVEGKLGKLLELHTKNNQIQKLDS